MKDKNHPFLKIGERKVGPGQPVFVIAELSGNHNQSFERAREMVKVACDCGVDAIKLQTYTADTLTIDSDKEWFQVKVNPAWRGENLYQLYQKAYTPWEWQPELKKIAQDRGVILFSTPYDETAVEFLEKMEVPAYKVSSFEVTDTGLLKKIASTKKPVIMSRGMASLEELELAISTLRESGTEEVAILHCISSYPARPEEMNLATIADIRKRFGTVVGLSDHSLGITASVASVALGASIIEKHFTLRRDDGGCDASFSLEPEEFKELIKSVREVEKAMGKVQYGAGKKESENIVFRRSLFVVKDMKEGEEFSSENVRYIRPGYGLALKFLPEILGKKARIDIERGTPLSHDLISD